jgi:hypothetical protein
MPTSDGRYGDLVISRLSRPSSGETNHSLPIPSDWYQPWIKSICR